jgi:hypothetical protein
MALTGKTFNENFERRIDKVFNDYYDDETLEEFFIRGLRMSIMSRYDYLNGQRRLDELRTLIVSEREIQATSGKLMLQRLPVTGYDATAGTFTLAYGHNVLPAQQFSYSLTGDTAINEGVATAISVTENTIVADPITGLGTFLFGELETRESLIDYLHLNSIQAKYKIQFDEPIAAIEASSEKVFILFDKRVTLRDREMILLSGVQGATSLNGEFFLKRVGMRKYQLFTDKNLKNKAVADHKYTGG